MGSQLPRDPVFQNVASTRDALDVSSRNVVLAEVGNAQERLVLGPVVMNSRSVVSAQAVRLQTGQWAVEWTFTPRGTREWDQFTRAQFHAMIAVVFQNRVIFAPLIQPTSSSFGSFYGQGEMTGMFSKRFAQQIAKALAPGPRSST